MMELVGNAQEEYQLKVALLAVEQGPSTTALLSSPPLQEAVAQEALETLELSSGSESPSQDEEEGEGADGHPHSTDILKSPWGVFFDQGAVAKEAGDSAKEAAAVAKEEGGGVSHRHVISDAGGGAVGHRSGGDKLNVAAPVFVPAAPFRFNIKAEAFVPIGYKALDSNRTLNS